MSDLFVDLAIPIAVDSLFTYRVPDEFHSSVARGLRALVPFGKRTVIGLIVNVSTSPNFEPTANDGRRIKPLSDLLDDQPILSDEMLRLTEWIAQYYIVPWGEVIKAALIQGATTSVKRTVRLHDNARHDAHLTPKQEAIVKELENPGALTIQQLQKKVKTRNTYAVVNELARKGVIIVDERPPNPPLRPKLVRVIETTEKWKLVWKQYLGGNEMLTRHARQAAAIRGLLTVDAEAIPVTQFLRSARQSLSSLRTLEKKGLLTFRLHEIIRAGATVLGHFPDEAVNIVLNDDQQKALNTIRGGLIGGGFVTYLLHGVTGSGKTQVYIEAIRDTLRLGKSAIVLVPEISLTPQAVHRFQSHFGDKVVSLHSRMSPGERYDAWRLIRSEKYTVVIGPRSAIFSPLNRLGLIVVDEEQEASFKQFDQTPRYHARDVAIMRASYTQAVVILGSATPSLESYTNALQGKYTLIELPKRVDNAKLPNIEIVDMAAERQRKLAAFRESRRAEFKKDPVQARASAESLKFGVISDLLKEKISDRLMKKEGIILLQNRRGFAPFLECPDCGHVVMCKNCSISLIYHLTKKHCRCHYCGYTEPPPAACPTCGSLDIQYRGFGTQRVEEELLQLFPGVSMVRMDLDTTTRKGSHSRILERFANREVDILLGTQMVAKGLDFSHVTLVGVISADTQMLLPDFRSSERTFQLLTQVAGRAGRSALAGEVIIQTLQRQHYALKHVIDHDFKSFYQEELAYRQELDYPPSSRLVLLECRGPKEPDVMQHAATIATLLKRQHSTLKILGPAPAAITKIDRLYRWHIVIKDPKRSDPSSRQLHAVVNKACNQYVRSPLGKNRSVRLIIDVDPAGMM